MPFIAPLIAPLIATAGIAAPAAVAASSLFGKGGGGSNSQKTFEQTQNDISQYGLTEAKKTIPLATDTLKLPLDFWKKILSGDRQTMMETLAPEIGSVSAQYQGARRAASEFSPRSGGRAAGLQESRFKESGDILGMMEKARPQAADAVTNIGQLMSQLGLGEMGTSVNASNSGGQIATQAREQDIANQQATGAGIGTLLSAVFGLL